MSERETRTVIDGSTAMRLLDEVVAEHGAETVYERPNGLLCFYAYEGKPSCLIGHVLNKAGVPVEVLEVMQYGPYPLSIGSLRAPEGFEFTDWGRRVMSAAQVAQDNGYSWGAARERAQDVADRLPLR